MQAHDGHFSAWREDAGRPMSRVSGQSILCTGRRPVRRGIVADATDATGSVIRKLKNCKRLLYYELSVQNPTGSGCSVPVAAMLPAEHTIRVIANLKKTDSQLPEFSHTVCREG